MTDVKRFIATRNRRGRSGLTALSLFSGAGLSDLGYELAGFKFHVQCELDEDRAELGKRNFPESKWIIGDAKEKYESIVRAYRRRCPGTRLALLSLTPPCQGVSSSNSGRGKFTDPKKSDQRNTLLLEALPVVKSLKPRVVVAENVATLLNRVVIWQGQTKTVVGAFADGLDDYHLFVGVVEMADYGIPQMRKRLVLVAIHKDELVLPRLESRKLLPWPHPTHAERKARGKKKWVTLRKWLNEIKYPPLDSQTKPAHPDFELHFVPKYPEGDKRYTLVSHIPPNSGRSGYENDVCLKCRGNSIPREKAYCPHCGTVLFSRPVTKAKSGPWRLIKGFDSSYRRAAPDQPAPTVMTNSSHIGSDNKIHPWEHRVLSTLECADLQTVPRFFDWSWALQTRHNYVVRNVVGEALPTYFTYLHGRLLVDLLAGRLPASKLSRVDSDGQQRLIEEIESEGGD